MNIAVLLGGTWSDTNTHTNIAQLDARVPRRVGGEAQEVCYIEGVGTGPFDRLQGGILGAGLTTTFARPMASSRRTTTPMTTGSISSAIAHGAFAARSFDSAADCSSEGP